MLIFLIIYLSIINITTFIVYTIDKNKKGVIKEYLLLILPIIGGGLGGYFVMIFRHYKTTKWYFTLTNILSIVLYSLIIYLIIK